MYDEVLHNIDYLEPKSKIKELKLEKANRKLSKNRKSSKNPQQKNKLKKSQKL